MIKKYIFEFPPEKNQQLMAERGVSFEDIIVAIECGALLDVVEHPNLEKYGHQKMYILSLKGYAYCVPFVENDNRIFLKTIFPSRRMTEVYIKKGN